MKYLSTCSRSLVVLLLSSDAIWAFVPTHPRRHNHQSTTALNIDLVERGKFEGELLLSNTKNPPAPLESNDIKGVGGGGGFGGKSLLAPQGKAHASVLKRNGVVRIDNVLSAELADEIRENAYALREESEELVKSGRVRSIDLFADVLLSDNRRDMTLPLGADDKDTREWMVKALASVLLDSSVGSTYQTLCGKKAILREWSCLMSDPSSNRQVIHPDTPYSKDAFFYTCFIALQDISLDMGPTTWMPKTHDSPEIHAQYLDKKKSANEEFSPKDKLIASTPVVLGTLTKGSCAIFDSRLLHAGGANTSSKSRALLYFTFQNSKVARQGGHPGSLLKNLADKWTLQQLQQELTKYQKGKVSKVFAQE